MSFSDDQHIDAESGAADPLRLARMQKLPAALGQKLWGCGLGSQQVRYPRIQSFFAGTIATLPSRTLDNGEH